MSLNEKDYEKLDKLPDDEAIIEIDKMIEKNDNILAEDDLSVLVEQEEKIVYYEIENIFKDPDAKAYRNRISMRMSPPLLVIKDSENNEVVFTLTEHLTDDLVESLKEVQRAYYGYATMERKDLPDKFKDRMVVYFNESPVKVVVSALILIFILFITLRGLIG